MVKYEVMFTNKETGNWNGTRDGFKTKKECIEYAKARAKMYNLTYKISSYIYNPYFGL